MPATEHVATDGTGAPHAPSRRDLAAPRQSPTTSTRPGHARRNRRRTVTNWVVLVVGLVLLWPAALGGITGLTIVYGNSMEPTYSTGDVVITVRQPDYQPGQVISYTVPEGQPGAGGHVIHRIDTIEDGIYTTIGDNNDLIDPWRITSADVTGAALAHIPGIGIIFSPKVLPFVVALAVGAIVTVLLWSSRTATDDDVLDHRSDVRRGRSDR